MRLSARVHVLLACCRRRRGNGLARCLRCGRSSCRCKGGHLTHVSKVLRNACVRPHAYVPRISMQGACMRGKLMRWLKGGHARTRVRLETEAQGSRRLSHTSVCVLPNPPHTPGTAASPAHASTAPGVATMPSTEKRMPATPNRSRVSLGSLVYAPQNPPWDMHRNACFFFS